MSRLERALVALAALAATASLAAGIERTALWPPNETRVAEIAREMLTGESWAVPQLNGEPFLEEPPLFYWLQAGAYRIAGAPSAAVARLPAVAGAILGVLVTVALAHALGANAVIAALVLATAPEYWWMARTATPDTTNAATTALALLAFYLAWRSERAAWLVLAAVAGGTAFWLKSLLGPGLAVATATVFVGLSGRHGLGWRALGGVLVALGAAAGAWLFLLWRGEGTGAVSFFVVTNHLGRLLGSPEQGHMRPVYYYLPNLLLDLLPWSIALPAALAAAWRRRADPARRFGLVWAAVMLLFLTASAGKSAHYLLPAYPALAVLIAQWWMEPSAGRLDGLTWAMLAVAALVVLPGAAVVASSLDPVRATALMATDHGARAAGAVAGGLRPGALAWSAIPVALLGVAFILGRRAGRPGIMAAAAAVSATTIHLLVVLVALPAFDTVVSARPVGEALGRAARGGIDVFTFGFDNRETVSQYLFYAEHRLPAVREIDALAERLLGRRACALVPAHAWERVRPALPGVTATARRIGGVSLMLVSGTVGGCPGTL
jgi:4-amino-4-deoxy-L-arabinose transferase-like glycosyltransferase